MGALPAEMGDVLFSLSKDNANSIMEKEGKKGDLLHRRESTQHTHTTLLSLSHPPLAHSQAHLTLNKCVPIVPILTPMYRSDIMAS